MNPRHFCTGTDAAESNCYYGGGADHGAQCNAHDRRWGLHVFLRKGERTTTRLRLKHALADTRLTQSSARYALRASIVDRAANRKASSFATLFAILLPLAA